MKLKAIIFDLDGVLLSTNILHREALISSIETVTGIDTRGNSIVSEESMLPSRLKIQKIQEIHKFHKSLCKTILDLKDEIFFELIADMVPENNVIECLAEIQSRGIPMAIASNTRIKNLDKVLTLTNLKNYFNVIVSGEEVARPKPAPDILFEVYSRLNLHSNECPNTVFVEDTDEGAAAGHASPSTVVRVNSPKDLSIDLFKDWL